VTFVSVGIGAFYSAAFIQISDFFSQKQGSAFGVNTAVLNLGGTFASGFAVVSLPVSS